MQKWGFPKGRGGGEGGRDEWFWLNTLALLRDAKKEQPICNWLDGWEAQVWPGAVSLEWGRIIRESLY